VVDRSGGSASLAGGTPPRPLSSRASAKVRCRTGLPPARSKWSCIRDIANRYRDFAVRFRSNIGLWAAATLVAVQARCSRGLTLRGPQPTPAPAEAEYWRDKVQAPVAQIIAAKLP
jgi:hypothetical protein